jgi:hypothetical protein
MVLCQVWGLWKVELGEMIKMNDTDLEEGFSGLIESNIPARD